LATVSTSLDESEKFADNEVELRRVGGVNAPVVSRDSVSNFLRQSHWLHCKLGHDSRRARTHRRHNSTRQLSRVGVGGVYWALGFFCWSL